MTNLEVSNLLMELSAHKKIRILSRKNICGFGVNDSDYVTTVKKDGCTIRCPAYVAWTSLITRAYSKKYHIKFPTYAGISVCEEWRYFMNFRSWWAVNNVDGWCLDKDLLSDSGVYSPDSCIYVPSWLNNFLIDSGAKRGNYPIGVYFLKEKGKFKSSCRNPITKNEEHLGLFDDPDSAHNAWVKRKIQIATCLKDEIDGIDSRIYQRVIEIIKRAK